MKPLGIRLDIYCYNGLAGACSRDAWLTALWSLSLAAREGLRPDVVSLNLCASAFEKRSLWRCALAVAGGGRAANAAMTAAGGCSVWQKGLAVLEHMAASSVQRSVVGSSGVESRGKQLANLEVSTT